MFWGYTGYPVSVTINRIPVCPFFSHGSPGENQGINGLCKLFDLRGQTIDVSNQAFLP